MVTTCDQPSQTEASRNAGLPAGSAKVVGAADTWNAGETKPLSVQVVHPSGTVLQLTSIQSRDMDTAVGIRVINGRERDVDLNRFNNRRNGLFAARNGGKALSLAAAHQQPADCPVRSNLWRRACLSGAPTHRELGNSRSQRKQFG